MSEAMYIVDDLSLLQTSMSRRKQSEAVRSPPLGSLLTGTRKSFSQVCNDPAKRNGCGKLTYSSLICPQRHWDATSQQDAGAQRQALIRRFVELGVQGRKDYETVVDPTAAEIASILEPWRPARLRAAASMVEVGVWLRLDWSDDAASARLQAEALWEVREGTTDGIIVDEPELCRFPADDCRRILEILPELVTAQDVMHDHDLVAEAVRKWRLAEAADRAELECAVQNYAVVATLVVEDGVSYEESEDADGEGDRGGVLQYMLDGRGDVVRVLRVHGQDAAALWSDWSATFREAFAVMTDGIVDLVYYESNSKTTRATIDMARHANKRPWISGWVYEARILSQDWSEDNENLHRDSLQRRALNRHAKELSSADTIT
nr:hypothetical protein CFP56_04029 [Quercus suber]